ncbi:Imm70 family immunity protein [Listeria aquatica]|uniref:Imm70 family immunity protein n=1 Tax=Listeria aquatica TaxID=1494960 RepID=UPI0031F4FCF9
MKKFLPTNNVGIKVDFLWFSIGDRDFLHSFFSTICINLEEEKWGSKYPIIMTKLYKAIRDIDFIDHGNSKMHPEFLHEYKWKCKIWIIKIWLKVYPMEKSIR